MTKNDPVNHPSHYADHYEHEVIELTEKLDFCLGNAVKYILRAPYKGNEVEDLKKAKWYLERIRNSDRTVWTKLDINDKDDMALIESYKVEFLKKVLVAFTKQIPAYMDNVLVNLEGLIILAENKELKKQLKEAKDQAFHETLKQLAGFAPNRIEFPNSIPTKYWMAGYAI